MLTIKCINQLPQALYSLCETLTGKSVDVMIIDEFLETLSTTENSGELKALFDKYGSDKATAHDYHRIYDAILSDRLSVKKIFEIGLGTNNPDIVSTMADYLPSAGKSDQPGGSLRAFRDLYANARIYGADIDNEILFSEERITTYFIDQTNIQTFETLGEEIGGEFDLMIDDGLHAPNANIHSLSFFLGRIKVGGWAVIEDIHTDKIDIWKLVICMLPDNFETWLVCTRSALMLMVRRSD